MFSIILYQPEIPPNTGNIIRLCANTGATLHLIEPLGFVLDDKNLRRAGLDYHPLTQIHVHPDFDSCLAHFSDKRIFALSAKGKTLYTTPSFSADDAFLFGPETRGLPQDVLQTFTQEHILRLPQITADRSLNLSNTAAVMLYEAWRQINFT
ncbi:TrmH family RNA methyltransferase [Candidatus Berkiella aquae]|uniref:tRNA (cytidine(34)-2'-O)-methyltransferase n=1 Tax=Candidatus Berkiella aquae TaxID=295108 RepID=A0A0Q9YQB9_9GAMM|nr:tRNA (cytidine(34)-2'-O)-methyltransferase [Candidatus Berkiella aquae]MCS5712676.1 tRNA (cytidine(34)-2'-O)-methyltransferase [Candidatus Berkiella aquae]